MSYLRKIFNKEKINEVRTMVIDKEYEHTLIEEIENSIDKFPNYNAIEYYGKNITYREFYNKIVSCAKSLKSLGVEKGNRITICMPNTPEAIIMFYAVNMIGATSSMIHPFSSVNEIEYYMDIANSKYVLTLDLFADKVIEASKNITVNKIIIAKATDSMFKPMRTILNIYSDINSIINNENIVKFKDDNCILWNDFIKLGIDYNGKIKEKILPTEEAVILYSGGTTGKPKGVILSSANFNAVSKQCLEEVDAKEGDAVLEILPIFHGFGLAVSIHSPLLVGAKCVLIPKFKPEDFARLIKLYKPVFLTGVPTMYEALIQNEEKSNYLKSVKNVIVGGDLLQPALRDKVNNYLSEHGSTAKIRVGYGLTESTAACILTPKYFYKESCIGKALSSTEVKIVKEHTTKEVNTNKVGEICISGPSVMLGYLNEEEETNNTLKVHEDGKIWLHTGDLGYKDKKGYIYFKSRLKRMIITSGYNIYPSVMEQIIIEHPLVENVVVVGIPHPYKKQVPIACIVLNKDCQPNAAVTEDIKLFCEKSISKYSMPYRYHYIKSIPKTLIGKINYKKLEEECKKKYEK